MNFFFKFLAIFLAGRYFPKSLDIFPIYHDILNISRYIQNIFFKFLANFFSSMIFYKISRYIPNISQHIEYIAMYSKCRKYRDFLVAIYRQGKWLAIYRDIADICNYVFNIPKHYTFWLHLALVTLNFRILINLGHLSIGNLFKLLSICGCHFIVQVFIILFIYNLVSATWIALILCLSHSLQKLWSH